MVAFQLSFVDGCDVHRLWFLEVWKKFVCIQCSVYRIQTLLGTGLTYCQQYCLLQQCRDQMVLGSGPSTLYFNRFYQMRYNLGQPRSSYIWDSIWTWIWTQIWLSCNITWQTTGGSAPTIHMEPQGKVHWLNQAVSWFDLLVLPHIWTLSQSVITEGENATPLWKSCTSLESVAGMKLEMKIYFFVLLLIKSF